MAIAILSCRSNTILVRGYELNKKKHKYEYVFQGGVDIRANKIAEDLAGKT